MNGLPTVVMSILCFDRKRQPPLPLDNRQIRLEWSRLTPDETSDFMAILNHDKSKFHPRGFDETVITVSHGSRAEKPDFLKYRHAFVEMSDDEASILWQREDRGRGHILSAPHEYIEDENGLPTSMYEIMQFVTGREAPIILGDPQSILRLGASVPLNAAQWTVEKANTIAQFLDVVRRIYHSEWCHNPASLTSVSSKSGESALLEAIFPNDGQVTSVLAYFRQLHAADKLYSKACDVYIAHVADVRKRHWVDHEKQSFELMIDEAPRFFQKTTSTRRKIIGMFMYGAGLLHSDSKYGEDRALRDLITNEGRHEAILLFNACLRDIYGMAVKVYHVIKQDFEHWIDGHGFTPPTRLEIPNLFEGFTSPPRDK